MWRRIFRTASAQPTAGGDEDTPTLELDDDDDERPDLARDPDAPDPRDREPTRKLRPDGAPDPAFRRFQVRILYREPTYELRHGRRDRPFRATFTVEAPSPEAAQELARRELREESKQRSVGWVYEIEAIECCES